MSIFSKRNKIINSEAFKSKIEDIVNKNINENALGDLPGIQPFEVIEIERNGDASAVTLESSFDYYIEHQEQLSFEDRTIDFSFSESFKLIMRPLIGVHNEDEDNEFLIGLVQTNYYVTDRSNSDYDMSDEDIEYLKSKNRDYEDFIHDYINNHHSGDRKYIEEILGAEPRKIIESFRQHIAIYAS